LCIVHYRVPRFCQKKNNVLQYGVGRSCTLFNKGRLEFFSSVKKEETTTNTVYFYKVDVCRVGGTSALLSIVCEYFANIGKKLFKTKGYC
jgi:hypothetical protein